MPLSVPLRGRIGCCPSLPENLTNPPPPITLALGLAVRLPEVPVAAQVSPPHPIWPPQELDSWNTPFWGQVPAIQLS